jgi:hypothetical protein
MLTPAQASAWLNDSKADFGDTVRTQYRELKVK